MTMMNGKFVEIREMKCKCGATAKYDQYDSVSFVDAHRALTARCTCKEE